MATQTQEAAYRSAPATMDRRPGRKPAPQYVSTKPGNRRSVDRGTGTSGRQSTATRLRARQMGCHVGCLSTRYPSDISLAAAGSRDLPIGKTWRVVVALLLKETLNAGYHKHQKRSRDSNAIQR